MLPGVVAKGKKALQSELKLYVKRHFRKRKLI